MKSVADWFTEYSESHAHSTNKLLHWICVPLIVLAVMGLLWSVPTPTALSSISPWLNLATLIALLALVYYAALSPALAIGIAIAFLALLATLQALNTLPWPLWITSLVIFVVAWIGQFIGHAVEGKRPSFCKDIQFLMIGPLWLVAALYKRLSIPY
jgi:uncharacterized membrane protein YGL010W